MSTYIPFTDEQMEMARRTDLRDFIIRQGEKVKRSGSEYQWSYGGEKITLRGNLWLNQYAHGGSDAIDFVREFYHMDFQEAVQFLLKEQGVAALPQEGPPSKEKLPFALPPRNDTMRRVYGYLINRRSIDREVLAAFIRKGMIYESADYHNAVFVGYDGEGVPRHAHKRGTGSVSTYKGNVASSLPEYSFHWHGTSDALCVFEAPIDMLSFITLHKEGWQRHSYAACCGVSSYVINQMMKDNPHIKRVYLCHDNDGPGQKAVERIAVELAEKGVPSEPLTSVLKDWNQDLTNPEEVEETLCSESMQML